MQNLMVIHSKRYKLYVFFTFDHRGGSLCISICTVWKQQAPNMCQRTDFWGFWSVWEQWGYQSQVHSGEKQGVLSPPGGSWRDVWHPRLSKCASCAVISGSTTQKATVGTDVPLQQQEQPRFEPWKTTQPRLLPVPKSSSQAEDGCMDQARAGQRRPDMVE